MSCTHQPCDMTITIPYLKPFLIMSAKNPTIAITQDIQPADLGNRIFDPSRVDSFAGFSQALKRSFNARGVDVVTPDMVPFTDENLKYVVYLDYSWRQHFRDPFLKQIPREKRVLIVMEPSSVNPSLYYTSFYRNLFSVVFAWNRNLLLKNPTYTEINILDGADPERFRSNPFMDKAFGDKKLLAAVGTNRWGYIPYSRYNQRIKAYKYFEHQFGNEFALYGRGWNQPRIFYEKWLGHQTFACYHGPIPGVPDEKIQALANYKFSVCFENNAFDPGYLSEKIFDCFCARCVPIYYGWDGADKIIPPECFINFRHFRNLRQLGEYIASMDAAHHQTYVDAINAFMNSSSVLNFTTHHAIETIFKRLFPSDS